MFYHLNLNECIIFDVPSTAFRGGHSHIEQAEVLIALSGSFEVVQ
jgi:hypothetical protein